MPIWDPYRVQTRGPEPYSSRAAFDPYFFDWSRTRRLWGGPIAFDYGVDTIRVANGVRLEEGQEILRELRKRD